MNNIKTKANDLLIKLNNKASIIYTFTLGLSILYSCITVRNLDNKMIGMTLVGTLILYSYFRSSNLNIYKASSANINLESDYFKQYVDRMLQNSLGQAALYLGAYYFIYPSFKKLLEDKFKDYTISSNLWILITLHLWQAKFPKHHDTKPEKIYLFSIICNITLFITENVYNAPQYLLERSIVMCCTTFVLKLSYLHSNGIFTSNFTPHSSTDHLDRIQRQDMNSIFLHMLTCNRAIKVAAVFASSIITTIINNSATGFLKENNTIFIQISYCAIYLAFKTAELFIEHVAILLTNRASSNATQAILTNMVNQPC